MFNFFSYFVRILISFLRIRKIFSYILLLNFVILVKNPYREILSIFVDVNRIVYTARTVRIGHMKLDPALQSTPYRIYFISVMSQDVM